MAGLRLDKALAQRSEIETRSRASHLIDEGLVQVNGYKAKSSLVLKTGDHIEIHLPEPEPTDLIPYDFPLDILFEDEHLIVINKPSGLVVHPAAGHAQDTLVNALLHHTKDLSMKFGEQRPGIVHRLDKETSGVLVVAKNDHAHEKLTQQFKERSIHRIYFAVAIGAPKPPKGSVQSYLARHPGDRKRYASILGSDRKIQTTKTPEPSMGKWAVTHYELLKSQSGLSYYRLKLETGRTHQIRVHLSDKGTPIAGDTLYGADKKVKSLESKKTQAEVKDLQRFLLHAAELGFTHPVTGKELFFSKDWPEEIRALLKAWGLL
ncbi:RluA family pseudouridine synthase [Bdellovibrio sp. HCB337]|uniref:RluA family pseudouridine synthase n=1 Tax=Bdellovibrio sp. HCB337 TaxID=3394358 RepID=UPI0039A5D21C